MRWSRNIWRTAERSIVALFAGVALAVTLWLLLEEAQMAEHRLTLVPAVLLYACWVSWRLCPPACDRQPCLWTRPSTGTSPHADRVAVTVLPVCAHCKAVRPHPAEDAEAPASWLRLEDFLTRLTALQVTHSICPRCIARHFPADDATRKT